MWKNYEHTTNRFPGRVGNCAPETAREREGFDPRPRRARRRASANALAGRGQAVPVRRPPRKSEPARPLRRAPSVDRVPRVLRTGRARLARAWMRRLRLKARKGEPVATRWHVLSETVADAALRQIGCTVGRELARV